MLKKLEVRAERVFYKNTIDLAVIEQLPGGRFAVGQPIVMQEVEEGYPVEPVISLNREQAQFLIDELWRCGLRPTEGTGSAGSLAATERHLADLQKITFGMLRKDGMQV